MKVLLLLFKVDYLYALRERLKLELLSLIQQHFNPALEIQRKIDAVDIAFSINVSEVLRKNSVHF